MQLRAFFPLTIAFLAACASAPARQEPADPVVWPAGTWLASARLEYTMGSIRAFSSARRLLQAEVTIDPAGGMILTTGEGSCREVDTGRADQRVFSCGDAVFRFALEGASLRGSGTAPVTYWVKAWRRCARWSTDGSECLRWDEHPEEERTTRTTAELAIVTAG